MYDADSLPGGGSDEPSRALDGCTCKLSLEVGVMNKPVNQALPAVPVKLPTPPGVDHWSSYLRAWLFSFSGSCRV
jgi:hypothetical protein